MVRTDRAGALTEVEVDADTDAPAHGPTYCDGPDAWQPGCGWCANCGARISITRFGPEYIGSQRRSRWFCKTRGTACRNEWLRDHQWPVARRAALKRDRRCVRCPAWESPPVSELQVNHIMPRNGGGYGTGCHNHQDNLESLCRRHHEEVTAEQQRALYQQEWRKEVKRIMAGPTYRSNDPKAPPAEETPATSPPVGEADPSPVPGEETPVDAADTAAEQPGDAPSDTEPPESA